MVIANRPVATLMRVLLAWVAPVSLAQPGRTTTPVNIAELFKQASVVADITYHHDGVEQCRSVTYESKVTEGFKGASKGERLFFFCDNSAIAGEDFVFLQHAYNDGGPGMKFEARIKVPPAPDEAVPKTSNIFFVYRSNNSYSIVRVQHVCVFDNVAGPSCDDGVRVRSREIALPNTVKTYPPDPSDESDASVRWVRRDVFLSLLRDLRGK